MTLSPLSPSRKPSAPERMLAGALWGLGAREWETEPRDLGGSPPDLFFRTWGLAVFVDGCGWHGCPAHWKPAWGEEHGTSRYRVLRQRHSDRVTREVLRQRGIRVLSFWEHEVRLDAYGCAKKVVEELRRAGCA